MATLSVILITFNEEKSLARCLESVSWADEIVIVDSFSQDQTKEVAKRFTDRIYDLKWPGFGPAKQFAVEKASCEWVLSLDADEVVSDHLQKEIRRAANSEGRLNGYFLRRQSNFLGRWIRHGGWYPDYVLRLFRRSKGRFTNSLVHERVILDGESGFLEGKLLHFTDPDLESYLTKLNRYTSLSSRELFQKGKRAGIIDICLRPLAIFSKMYVVKLGFLDGVQGLLLACFSGFHVLTKYAKLWHLQYRNK